MIPGEQVTAKEWEITRRSFVIIVALASLIVSAQVGLAIEAYTYDARGRLTNSTSSSASREVYTAIAYDRAGNRESYNVIGARDGEGGAAESRRLIVVPLNGFTVIPIQQ